MINLSAGLGRYATILLFILGLGACGGGGGAGGETVPNTGEVAASSSSSSGTGPGIPDTQSPAPPANLRVAGSTPGSVVLSWTAAADNVAVAAYDVYRNGSYLGAVSATTLVFVDSSVSPGQPYRYAVKARDAAGNVSTVSVEVAAVAAPAPTSKDTAPPTAPGALRASGTTTSTISLSWDAATDEVGVVLYEISRDGVVIASLAATSLSYTLTGLTPATACTLTVRARDAAGNQSAAATIRLSTLAAPPSSASSSSSSSAAALAAVPVHRAVARRAVPARASQVSTQALRAAVPLAAQIRRLS